MLLAIPSENGEGVAETLLVREVQAVIMQEPRLVGLCLYCVKRKWVACSAVELPPMYTVYSVPGSTVDCTFAL